MSKHILEKVFEKRNLSTANTPSLNCAGSQFIGDGICDESANKRICQYDGGDCCLPDKSTPLCHECTCILKADKVDTEKIFQGFNVTLLSLTTSQFNGILAWTNKVVNDVLNENVCTVLCAHSDLSKEVNSWVFDFKTKSCSCLWILKSECVQHIEGDGVVMANPLEVDDVRSMQSGSEKVIAFLQMTKTVSCGMCVSSV